MSTDYKIGDRVKVVIEGTVNRVLNFDGTQELRIDADGLDNFVYTDSAKVEKVEPEAEVFGPGTVVRGRFSKKLRVVTKRGILDARTGETTSDSLEDATSEYFERVEVG